MPQRRMGDEGIPLPFLNAVLDGSEWSESRLGRITPLSSTSQIGVWVGHRAGLKAVEYRKISWLRRVSNPGSLDRSSSLHRLSYPCSLFISKAVSNE
jgi:hypothetical protein